MQIHREQFLRYCVGSAATLGLPKSVLSKLEQALSVEGLVQPKVIWLNGANCCGCTLSLTNLFNKANPTATTDSLFDTIDHNFHPSLMVKADNLTIEQLANITEGNFILAVDGGIPTAYNGYGCMLWTDQGEEVTVKEAVQMLAPKAAVVLAIGTCASFGAVPFDDPNQTDIVSVGELTGVTTVNIPGCPTHPDWIVWTLAHLLSGETLQTDDHHRPIELYGTPTHEHDAGKEELNSTQNALQFTKVAWSTTASLLEVKGRGLAGHIVTIYNVDSGALLGAVPVSKSGRWTFRHKNPSPIPLRLLAKIGDETVFSEVAKAAFISH
jgi:hydrogenase small subunit